MTMPSHEISAGMLDRLAVGKSDPDTIQTIGAAQVSKRLLLIKYLVGSWPAAACEHAVAVLNEAQRHDHATVASLLAEPHTGAWSAQAARSLRGSGPAESPVGANATYLNAVAAAAAVRVGLDAELMVHSRRGLASVPSLGAATLPLPDNSPVRVIVADRRLRFIGPDVLVQVDDPAVSAPDWLPLRRFSADANGRQLTVALDDIDPHRDSYHIPAADRLSDDEAQRWNELLGAAWQLLASRSPGQASELAAGLRTMVPLAGTDSGPARSATVRDAFGSFGLTSPDNPVELAIAMVHEFQHSKLSGLLDLVPLHEPSGPETYFAPWRRDPRPLGGLFQGVYAFLGIADLWCALRDDPALRPAAERGLATVREQVRAGLAELADSGKLTATGERFVEGMRTRLDILFAVRVPAGIAYDACEALRRNHAEWLRRNRRD